MLISIQLPKKETPSYTSLQPASQPCSLSGLTRLHQPKDSSLFYAVSHFTIIYLVSGNSSAASNSPLTVFSYHHEIRIGSPTPLLKI